MVSRLVPTVTTLKLISIWIQTIIPDYFYGDAIPADALSSGNFDFAKWLPNHTQDKTQPAIDKVVEALKSEGVTEFAATGYCFGGTFWFFFSLIHDEYQLVHMKRSLCIWHRVRQYHQSRSCLSPIFPQDSWWSRGMHSSISLQFHFITFALSYQCFLFFHFFRSSISSLNS